jgi:CheY-like chemotaxis protein/CRP-like cAMP-binding protein
MRTILIIDDHDEIRDNIAEILSLGGYKTLTAPNGKKGVEEALQHKPDLIVCDIMMPELDGYGVLHLLRKNPETEHLPVIFLTAKAERSDFRKGMEMGADDYLTKPFDDLELLNAIEVRLKKAELLEKKFGHPDKGVGELMKDLQSSGILPLNVDDYDSENYNRKQTIYSEGKRPKYLYFVKSGKAKSYRMSEDGKEYITNLYSSGDYLGYLPLLEDKVYEETTEMLDEGEIIMIPREDFLNVLYNDISIATRFIKLISQDVREKEERLLHLAYDSLRKRVARGLVDIYNRLYKQEAQDQPIHISRDDIARYVGTATESLIRTLSDFKSEKLIDIKDGKIRILDHDKLSHLLY